MSDLYQQFGSDLTQSATGDLLKVDGSTQGQQRLLRRLLTNPALKDASGNVTVVGDYIFHPDYGAGLPRLVGATLDIAQIKGLIRGQVLMEASVARVPEPSITVNAIQNGVSVYIRYNDAQTGKPVALSFDVNK